MMNDSKKWYQSKTVLLAVLQGVAGVVVAIQVSSPELFTVGIGAFVKSVLDIYLRYATTIEIR
jgi:hypothetical protein